MLAASLCLVIPVALLQARATFEAGLRLLRTRGRESGSRGAGHGGGARFLRQYALFEKRSGCEDAAAELFRQAAKRDPQVCFELAN